MKMNLIDRADALLTIAHTVENARELVTYQMTTPHVAKEADEGNERAGGVQGDSDKQLMIHRQRLFERSRAWDYKMRALARQMSQLEAEMTRAIQVDDENPPHSCAIKTPGQIFAKADILAGQ